MKRVTLALLLGCAAMPAYAQSYYSDAAGATGPRVITAPRMVEPRLAEPPPRSYPTPNATRRPIEPLPPEDWPGAESTSRHPLAPTPVAAPMPVQQRRAAPPPPIEERPQLGGGFIEFLMTGRSSGAPAAPQGRRSSNEFWGEPVPTQRVARATPMQVESDEAVEPAFDPRFARTEVAFEGRYAPGTIVINSRERFLYFVQPGGRAMRYGVGVGRPGFEWRGEKTISMKREWPDWRPPDEMLKRRPDLPRHMPGGPANPLGARAMYLGSSMYRIHGSNEPHTIGQAVSSGCVRMRNEDVVDLYNRVKVGTRVVML